MASYTTVSAGMAEYAVAHLHHDRVGSPVDISRSETQQAIAGADKSVLAAVVIDQAVAVVAAVVFDGQVPIAIKQVSTP